MNPQFLQKEGKRMNIKQQAIDYLDILPPDKLESALDYIRYLYNQYTQNKEEYPLDEFDYELAERADERMESETVSFDEALRECELTYADLQD